MSLTVRQLRQLLSNVSGSMPVMFLDESGRGIYPDPALTGVSEFSEPVDENGNPVPDAAKLPLKFFVIGAPGSGNVVITKENDPNG